MPSSARVRYILLSKEKPPLSKRGALRRHSLPRGEGAPSGAGEERRNVSKFHLFSRQCVLFFQISPFLISQLPPGGSDLDANRRGLLNSYIKLCSIHIPGRMRLEHKGLSHGLKTCPRHVFLTAFRAPSPPHKKTARMGGFLWAISTETIF